MTPPDLDALSGGPKKPQYVTLADGRELVVVTHAQADAMRASYIHGESRGTVGCSNCLPWELCIKCKGKQEADAHTLMFAEDRDEFHAQRIDQLKAALKAAEEQATANANHLAERLTTAVIEANKAKERLQAVLQLINDSAADNLTWLRRMVEMELAPMVMPWR